MPSHSIIVPTTLRPPEYGTAPLKIRYSWSENWYNDETQFDNGQLSLVVNGNLVVKQIDLDTWAGNEDSEILEYVQRLGWLGDTAKLQVLQKELNEFQEQLQIKQQNVLNAQADILAALPAVFAAWNTYIAQPTPNPESFFTPQTMNTLNALKNGLANYSWMTDAQRSQARRVRDLEVEIAVLQQPVDLDREVRSLLNS